jgi:hypothetical protein
VLEADSKRESVQLFNDGVCRLPSPCLPVGAVAGSGICQECPFPPPGRFPRYFSSKQGDLGVTCHHARMKVREIHTERVAHQVWVVQDAVAFHVGPRVEK